jgi:DNA mismatch endonuclease (patch repair protein)
MADVFTRRQRSILMARIRSRGNLSTEIRVMSLLRGAGLKGWRRNWPVFGKPDFVFPVGRIAVFVDGCFWHGCPRCKRIPSSSTRFWNAKIGRNVRRDRKVSRKLRSSGWSVVRVRECRLRTPRRFINVISKLLLR